METMLTLLGVIIFALIIRWLERNVFNKNRYTRRK
jgi:hypothetical protein